VMGRYVWRCTGVSNAGVVFSWECGLDKPGQPVEFAYYFECGCGGARMRLVPDAVIF
jgi:hypothetical protein